jgi:hypothetical protein
MVNCVFADDTDVLDKLEYLFANPRVLQQITDAGHDLVHARHTLRQRSQIRAWLDLHRIRRDNQKIIQPDPFASPILISTATAPTTPWIVSNARHLALLSEGDSSLAAGNFAEAERAYRACLGFTRMLPEAKLRIALCALNAGDARKALSWLSDPLQYTLVGYKASSPDPVEWAIYLVALLCAGRVNRARRFARAFPDLSHPVLGCARLTVAVCTETSVLDRPPPTRKPQPSIHEPSDVSAGTWLETFRKMLIACGQTDLAAKLDAAGSLGKASPARLESHTQAARGRMDDASLHVALYFVLRREYERLRHRFAPRTPRTHASHGHIGPADNAFPRLGTIVESKQKGSHT